MLDEALLRADLLWFETDFRVSDFERIESDGLVIESMRHARPIAAAIASHGPHVLSRLLESAAVETPSRAFIDEGLVRGFCCEGFDMNGSGV